MVTPYKL